MFYCESFPGAWRVGQGFQSLVPSGADEQISVPAHRILSQVSSLEPWPHWGTSPNSHGHGSWVPTTHNLLGFLEGGEYITLLPHPLGAGNNSTLAPTAPQRN